jgi:hypothetical protein
MADQSGHARQGFRQEVFAAKGQIEFAEVDQ